MKSKTSNHPRGRYRHHMYIEVHKSLMPIIERHDLNSDDLVDAFVEAWTNKTSPHGEWLIQCRQQREDSTIFLITSGDKVIAQLPLPHVILKDTQNLKQMLKSTPRQTIEVNIQKDRWNIGDLRPGMKSITIVGTVQHISSKSAVTTRWGTESVVANTTINDGTGTILFSLWNSQIDHVQVGDQIEIRKGYIITYRDNLQIRLGRKGSYEIIYPPSSPPLHEHPLAESS